LAIDTITMVGNTGTCIDSPYHRDPDGADLAGFALDCVADLPAVVEHLTGQAALPETGSHVTAVPPKVVGFGTFPVRAFARVPD
jgi:kynurenine formamidase